MAKRCSEIHSATMPSRTKAQRAARFARAVEEERLLYKRFALVSQQADEHWRDYLDAKALRCRLERTRG